MYWILNLLQNYWFNEFLFSFSFGSCVIKLWIFNAWETRFNGGGLGSMLDLLVFVSFLLLSLLVDLI